MRAPGGGIRAVSYAFPKGRVTLDQLESEGPLETSPDVLAAFGFEGVHISVDESPFALAKQAAKELLDEGDIDPESIDLLIYAGAQGPTAFTTRPSDSECVAGVRTTDRFRYPGTRLQYALGLERASVLGLEQLACTTLFSAVRLATALCSSEGLRRVLCVASEFYPADAGREAIFNCTSDAAVALLVERGSERNRVRASTQVTKGFYWDAPDLKNEIVASYFPTSKHVIELTLERAEWTEEEVDWVIPHNVSRRSWEILLRLVGLPAERLFDRNIPRDGHNACRGQLHQPRRRARGWRGPARPQAASLLLRLRSSLVWARTGGVRMRATSPTSREDRILLTGATGLVGAGVLRRLLVQEKSRAVYVLVRSPERLPCDLRSRSRVVPLTGDITLPGLGLDADVLRRLAGSVGVVIHSAADTRFSQTREEARRTNVLGTRNVLEVAAS